MTDDKSIEELASAFIVSTCQRVSKSFSFVSDHMHNLDMSEELSPKGYSILCGSFAEFYIRPLIPCISDIDFLSARTNQLAFCGDYPVLPSDMSGLAEAIACLKMESYHIYPGFVRLRVIGEMIYNWKYKKYKLKRCWLPNGVRAYLARNNMTKLTSKKWIFSSKRIKITPQSIAAGPAVQNKLGDYNNVFRADEVQSMWCPQWPIEAENWPKRPRNFGWPAPDTISEVVLNGCHVVHAQHRSCRDDEEQWRLSFSFAEIILVHSWTQIQQIVYHLLRFFAKRELIQTDCIKEDEVLCMYHLKTLMLWTCEEMSPEWWNSASVIAICCELLKKLSEWLKRKYCPNYFIPEANLFYEQWNPKMCERCELQLNKFCKFRILCDWFVEVYIYGTIRTHYKVEDTNGRKPAPYFEDYMLHLFELRKASESESLNMVLSSRFTISHNTLRPIFKLGLTCGLRQKCNIGCCLKKVDARTDIGLTCRSSIEKDLCFTYYENVLHILHAAYAIGFGEISWDSSSFIELIKAILTQPKMVRSQYHNFPKTYSGHNSRFQFLRAHNLMGDLTGSNSRSEFQLLSFMSKELLRKTVGTSCPTCLLCKTIDSAALAYLAALHFATSEYQPALQLCLAVSEDKGNVLDKETLNAGCLLFIDDVAKIVGLLVLQKKITEINLNPVGGHLYLDLRLSPEVFAHYLAVLSAQRISNHLDFDRDLPYSAFPFDDCLKVLLKQKFIISMKSDSHTRSTREKVYCRIYSLTETKIIAVDAFIVKETIINLLLEYALENLASFYGVFQSDFRIECNTVDCYRALLLYKCHQHVEVMHLCERILKEPDVQNELTQFAFANVLLLPPFDSYFDGDVQSLLGFHTLFYYLSPLNDKIRKDDFTDDDKSSFAQWFALEVYVYGMQLSTCKLISRRSISIKCYYFLGRHFLARYLKLICCIDCKLPCTDALAEFVAQKTKLPFELIIRRCLLHKLSNTRK